MAGQQIECYCRKDAGGRYDSKYADSQESDKRRAKEGASVLRVFGISQWAVTGLTGSHRGAKHQKKEAYDIAQSLQARQGQADEFLLHLVHANLPKRQEIKRAGGDGITNHTLSFFPVYTAK